MTHTLAEKRAYARGYNGANKASWQRVQRVIEIAKRYRERSALPQEVGRQCSGCSHWLRGARRGSELTFKWGSCSGAFDWGIEPRAWVDGFECPNKRQHQFITSEDFGCVNWTPKQ